MSQYRDPDRQIRARRDQDPGMSWTYNLAPECRCDCSEQDHTWWCPLGVWLNRRRYELEQINARA